MAKETLKRSQKGLGSNFLILSSPLRQASCKATILEEVNGSADQCVYMNHSGEHTLKAAFEK